MVPGEHRQGLISERSRGISGIMSDVRSGGTTILGRLASWGLAGLLGVGCVSLLLAMFGVLTPWLAWPLGLLASFWIGKRFPPDDQLISWVVATIVMALAGAVMVLGLVSPHERLLAGRDAGTYSTTAAWVSHHGSILIDSGSEQFAGLDVTFDSPGFIANPDRTEIYPQFMHLFPVLMGLVGMTFGLHSVLAIGPIVGAILVLVTYLLARRFVGEWWALLATTVVAVGLPFLYYTRAPFSESLAMVFGLAGVWLGMRAFASRDKTLATLSGICLGAVFVTRIDGVLVLLGLVAFVGGLELLGRDEEMQLARRMRMTALAVSMVGWVDGLVFSPYYMAYHGRFALPVMMALLFIWVAVPIIRKTALGRFAADNSVRMAHVVVASLGLWLVYAALQSTDPASTGAWLTWYLGLPLLLCALIGLLWSTHRFISGVGVEQGLGVSLLVVAAAVYMFRPSIVTDHIWAMRRFLPVILPLAVIFGVWAVEQATKRWSSYRPAVASVAVVAFLLPGLLVTVPLGAAAELEGVSTALDEACSSIGPDAVVLLREELQANVMMPALRGWCDVPVARLIAGSASEVEQWATRVAATGRKAFVATESLEDGGVTLLDIDFRILEIALTSPPRRWLDLGIDVTLREVR